MSSARQRIMKPSTANIPESPAEDEPSKVKSDSFISLLDVVRVIALLLCASFAASYFVTKEDIWWGRRPAFTTVNFWQNKLRGELVLTPEQLKKHDGSDPTIPLYLAVNGTIYDVSNGRRFYGPSGSYKWFAGADGTRAFVTGCFQEDITPDLRGVETMYLPADNPEIDSQFTSGELKKQKERERRYAKQEVEKSVKHWTDFFAKSKKYNRVGTVKAPEPTGPPPPLCQKAQDGRPKRNPPGEAKQAA